MRGGGAHGAQHGLGHERHQARRDGRPRVAVQVVKDAAREEGLAPPVGRDEVPPNATSGLACSTRQSRRITCTVGREELTEGLAPFRPEQGTRVLKLFTPFRPPGATGYGDRAQQQSEPESGSSSQAMAPLVMPAGPRAKQATRRASKRGFTSAASAAASDARRWGADPERRRGSANPS